MKVKKEHELKMMLIMMTMTMMTTTTTTTTIKIIKYKEDQFVNIVKVHESTQPNMNSILKSAAKIIEEVNQLSGMNDAKQDGMQHTKGRLGEALKKK